MPCMSIYNGMCLWHYFAFLQIIIIKGKNEAKNCNFFPFSKRKKCWMLISQIWYIFICCFSLSLEASAKSVVIYCLITMCSRVSVRPPALSYTIDWRNLFIHVFLWLLPSFCWTDVCITINFIDKAPGIAAPTKAIFHKKQQRLLLHSVRFQSE